MESGKRIIIYSGHYGSGKTNIALAHAFALRERKERVIIADIDIVNPYFRTKDSAKELEAAGIRLVSSAYAGTNVDVPALPKDIYAVTDDREARAIVDVGGDDRGALALGRLSADILRENNFDMFFVVNFYRPLTRTAEDALAVMREIESAARLPFTGIVNNSNIGAETRAADVLASIPLSEALSRLSRLPVAVVAAAEEICGELAGSIKGLRPLRLQRKII